MHYNGRELAAYLLAEDHQFLARLQAIQPGRTLPLRAARKRLFDAIRTRLGAFEWMWAHSFLDTNEMSLFNLSFQTGEAMSLRQGYEHAKRAFRIPTPTPDNTAIHELVALVEPFTCTTREVISAEYWDNTPEVRHFVERTGLDDVIYSIYPYTREREYVFFVGFGIGRGYGRAPFTLRETALVQAAFEQAEWARQQGLSRSYYQSVLALTRTLALDLAVMTSRERASEFIECKPKRSLERTWREVRTRLSMHWPRGEQPPKTPQQARHFFEDE